MTQPRVPSPSAKRAICDRCGARGWLEPGETRICAECGGPYRQMALLEGLVDRWFAPPPQHVSELYPRHLKLIELMWTADGRGREMYDALGLDRLSYSQFVSRATQLVVVLRQRVVHCTYEARHRLRSAPALVHAPR